VVSDPKIRVLVADDHTVVREGIRNVLSEKHGFDLVAEAANGDQAIELARKLEPDVILMDITLPGESGLEITVRLRSDLPESKVLILTMHDRGEYVLEAMRAGARGYVLKDAGAAELRDAVRAVHRGEEFFSPRLAAGVSAALRGEEARQHRQGLLEGLTSREREVLTWIARGKTNKEIGIELAISPRTVESHRDSLINKLGIRSVAELTRFAMESGLIDN
jgi:DNA-binding NarL/FixJ family response regulator